LQEIDPIIDEKSIFSSLLFSIVAPGSQDFDIFDIDEQETKNKLNKRTIIFMSNAL
jgi:hypothetical protein